MYFFFKFLRFFYYTKEIRQRDNYTKVSDTVETPACQVATLLSDTQTGDTGTVNFGQSLYVVSFLDMTSWWSPPQFDHSGTQPAFSSVYL